ncbi:two-component sensor kinase [Lactobacillus rhamnosus GG] [Lacticaseibacillus rhamnosus]|nr:two-component sensor kinase [Lactobacillus rhamnosus GG] [Lacticaseibacillus rhamnosus]
MRHSFRLWFSNLEWTSYVWLLYWPYIMSEFIPTKSSIDWLWIGLGVLFLVVYILVNEIDRWLAVTIPLEPVSYTHLTLPTKA